MFLQEEIGRLLTSNLDALIFADDIAEPKADPEKLLAAPLRCSCVFEGSAL